MPSRRTSTSSSRLSCGTGVGASRLLDAERQLQSTPLTRTLPWNTSRALEFEGPTEDDNDDDDAMEVDSAIHSDDFPDHDETDESHDFVDLTISPTVAATRRARASAICMEGRTRASSWIWHLGDEVERDGGKKWKCGLCRGHSVKEYSLGSTCHIRRHLRDKHQFVSETRLGAITPGQATIDRYLNNNRIDPIVFKRAVVDFFLTCRIPFHVAESPAFHALIDSVSTTTPAIPKSADTIRNWVLTRYQAAKAELRLKLAKSRSLITISLDCWTSPNKLAIIAVVAHWADEYAKFQKAVLALRELAGIFLSLILLTRRPPYRGSYCSSIG